MTAVNESNEKLVTEHAAQLDAAARASDRRIAAAAAAGAFEADEKSDAALERAVERARNLIDELDNNLAALAHLFGKQVRIAVDGDRIDRLNREVHGIVRMADDAMKLTSRLRAGFDQMYDARVRAEGERDQVIHELVRLYTPGTKIARARPPEWLASMAEHVEPF